MDQKEKHEVLFINLVMMFHSLVWQQLGKVTDPSTGSVVRNLEGARALIDTLEMLEEKTEGHRSVQEDRILRDSLRELRLNYVDEVQRESSLPEEKQDPGGAGEKDT